MESEDLLKVESSKLEVRSCKMNESNISNNIKTFF